METNKVEALSIKQYRQLHSICRQTQPYLPFTNVVFIELLKITVSCVGRYQWSDTSYSHAMRTGLKEFRQKYYPYGFKVNNKTVWNVTQVDEIKSLHKPRVTIIPMSTSYSHMEKIVFVQTVRACYKYMISADNEMNTDVFIEKMNLIFKLISE